MRELIAVVLLLMLALAAVAACGGPRPDPSGPSVDLPDAAPPVARPARADCEQAVAHLLELYGDPTTDEAREQLVVDCTVHATAEAVACVLRARNRDTLAQCGGLQ